MWWELSIRIKIRFSLKFGFNVGLIIVGFGVYGIALYSSLI